MQLLGQCIAPSPSSDEIFHLLRFVDGTAFKAARVVKDKLGIALEYELTLDVLFPTLHETNQ